MLIINLLDLDAKGEHKLVGSIYRAKNGRRIKITGVLNTGAIYGMDLENEKHLEYNVSLNCLTDREYDLVAADPKNPNQREVN